MKKGQRKIVFKMIQFNRWDNLDHFLAYYTCSIVEGDEIE